MSNEKVIETRETLSEVDTLAIAEEGRPSKVALEPRGKRPAEKKANHIILLGCFIALSGYIPLLAAPGWWAVGPYCAALLVGFAVIIFGARAATKAYKQMKCKGCWKTMVRTPYCPFCGTRDPLDDYDQWLEQEAAKPLKEKSRGLRRLIRWADK